MALLLKNRSRAAEHLLNILNNEKLSKNLEKSIYNWSLQQIKTKQINPLLTNTSWNMKDFKEKYSKHKIKLDSICEDNLADSMLTHNHLSPSNNNTSIEVDIHTLTRKYSTKARSIIFNLNDNKSFKEDVLNGHFGFRTIPYLLPQDICPSLYKPMLDLHIKREKIAIKEQSKDLKNTIDDICFKFRRINFLGQTMLDV